MSIDPHTTDCQLRSEERDSTRHVPLKKRPAPPNGDGRDSILGYKHLTPNRVKKPRLFARAINRLAQLLFPPDSFGALSTLITSAAIERAHSTSMPRSFATPRAFMTTSSSTGSAPPVHP